MTLDITTALFDKINFIEVIWFDQLNVIGKRRAASEEFALSDEAPLPPG